MLKSIRLPMVCILSLAFANGHDLYLLPAMFKVSEGTTIQVSAHNGDSFPASETAPVIARLRDAQLLGKQGVSQVRNLRVVGKETIGEVDVPGKGSLLLAVRTTPNFIELAPNKFLAYLKEEGLDEVIKWRTEHGVAGKPGRERYSKYAKSLLQSGSPNDFYRHRLGFPIEIIPLADPSALHPGNDLPIQITFRGKPAPNLQLEAAWSLGAESKTTIIGRSDNNGNISVPITKAGKWRLHSLQMERCSEPGVADWESSWASLTFEIN